MRVLDDSHVDVAIVGGGVAGAYCAWRLLCDASLEEGRRPRVALFEASGRIGGRLLSVRPPGMERLVAELGGGYFADTHRLVCAAFRKLELPVEAIPTPTRNLFHLRGAKRATDLSDAPYSLAPVERARPAAMLFPAAIEQLSPGLLRSDDLEATLERSDVQGTPLRDWGFRNLLAQGMSEEAFRLVRDTSPADYVFVNWNAADALRALLAFGKDTKMFHCPAGYACLPQAMLDEAAREGGETHLGHTLVGFERDADGVRLAFDHGGETIAVRARKVVLALPRAPLQALFRDAHVRALLDSVMPIPMFKTFFCHESPWWQDLGFTSGFAITDMPARSTFYWGTEEASRRALLMASLSYRDEADYWAVLRDGATPRGDSPSWSEYEVPANGRMVRELRRQLSEAHGAPIPEPYAAACIEWPAAIHFWRPRVASRERMDEILHPIAELPIYVCGEAYSRTQGWAEGALETAELVLQRHLGLAPPQ